MKMSKSDFIVVWFTHTNEAGERFKKPFGARSLEEAEKIARKHVGGSWGFPSVELRIGNGGDDRVFDLPVVSVINARQHSVVM